MQKTAFSKHDIWTQLVTVLVYDLQWVMAFRNAHSVVVRGDQSSNDKLAVSTTVYLYMYRRLSNYFDKNHKLIPCSRHWVTTRHDQHHFLYLTIFENVLRWWSSWVYATPRHPLCDVNADKLRLTHFKSEQVRAIAWTVKHKFTAHLEIWNWKKKQWKFYA